jgi:hypothetical protein
MNATLHPIEDESPELDAEGQAPEMVADEPDDDLLFNVQLPHRELAALMAAKLEGLSDLFWFFDGLASFSTERRAAINLHKKDDLNAYLRRHLQCFRWHKPPGTDKDPEKRPAEPPATWADDVRLDAMRGNITLRHVASVHDGPVLHMQDGRVCLASAPGFTETAPAQGVERAHGFWVKPHDAAGLLPHGDLPQYSQQDAARAAQRLLDVVPDFQWKGDADRSVWVALILTLMGSQLYAGPHPAFVMTAKHRGAGKTLLAQVAIAIATMGPPDHASTDWPDDDAETAKRLGASALAGDSVCLWDNLKRPISGACIEQFVTSSKVKVRILGRSEMPAVAYRPVHIFTMNTARGSEDMAERCLTVTLASTSGRRNQQFDDLPSALLEQRVDLYMAGTTILAAWLQARARGEKVTRIPSGSFDEWGAVVQAACVYAGLRDPKETQAALNGPRDEAYAEAIEQLLRFQNDWPGRFNEWSAADLKAVLDDPKWSELEQALRPVVFPDDANADKATALTVHRVSSKTLNAGLERLREWAELHQGLMYAFRKRVTQGTARYVVQPRQAQPDSPAPSGDPLPF